MGKVIKRGATPPGDISPETGFVDSVAKRAPIIDKDTYEARSRAQEIRERAESEASTIVEQARAQAAELLEAARAEAEKMKADAQQNGYDEGRATGASELSELVARTSARLQQIETQAVPQLRDLGVTIARKILGRELQSNPEAVIDLVKQALSEKARQRREIYLRVHPDDLQFIRDNKEDLLEVLSRAKEIGLREDPDVARHGVVIETDAGTIDAQLDTQLEVFERVLKETP